MSVSSQVPNRLSKWNQWRAQKHLGQHSHNRNANIKTLRLIIKQEFKKRLKLLYWDLNNEQFDQWIFSIYSASCRFNMWEKCAFNLFTLLSAIKSALKPRLWSSSVNIRTRYKPSGLSMTTCRPLQVFSPTVESDRKLDFHVWGNDKKTLREKFTPLHQMIVWLSI